MQRNMGKLIKEDNVYWYVEEYVNYGVKDIRRKFIGFEEEQPKKRKRKKKESDV